MSDKSSAAITDVDTSDMIDIVFDLDGTSVPLSYPFELWSGILQCLPWLNNAENVGIIPLRGSVSDDTLLLSKRTKLILRLPSSLAVQAEQLSGCKLSVGGCVLVVGKGKVRPLQPTTTLHAYLVESNLSEIEFLADMKQKLQSMNVACNLICDKKREVVAGKQVLRGFGLVLHDLKPLASMQIQKTGLGGARHLGCGIFVPFKAISGLE